MKKFSPIPLKQRNRSQFWQEEIASLLFPLTLLLRKKKRKYKNEWRFKNFLILDVSPLYEFPNSSSPSSFFSDAYKHEIDEIDEGSSDITRDSSKTKKKVLMHHIKAIKSMVQFYDLFPRFWSILFLTSLIDHLGLFDCLLSVTDT